MIASRRPTLLSLLIATSFASFAAPARAEVAPIPPPAAPAQTTQTTAATPEPSAVRLPVAAAQRPLTQPRFVLSPRLELDFVHTNAGMSAYLDGAAAFGITDNFEVSALVLPLQLSEPGSGFQYGQNNRLVGPSIGAVYRFLPGRFELGLGVEARVYTIPHVTGFSIAPSIPMHFHATESLRLDLVPSVEFVHSNVDTSGLATAPGQPAVITTTGVIFAAPTPIGVSYNASQNPVRLFVPVRAVYNVEEAVHIGVNSGLTIYDLGDTSNTMGIPLGVSCGYAVAGASGPIVDINPLFNFPYLLMPGRHEVTNTNQWVVGVNVIGHIYL
jgi:hypothetical protein